MDVKNISKLERLLSKYPEDSDVAHELIKAYIGYGDYYKALELTMSYREKIGDTKQNTILLARIYNLINNYNDSLRHWIKVLFYDSTDLNAYFQIIGLCLKLNNIDKAKYYLRNMQEVSHDNDLTILSAGRIAYIENNWTEIDDNYLKLIDRNVFLDESYYKLVISNIKRKDFTNAITILNNIKNDKFDESKKMYLFGRAYFGLGNYDSAINYFKRNILLNKHFVENSHLFIVKSYYKLLDIESAEKYIETNETKLSSTKLIEELNNIKEKVSKYKNKVLLIGTCRIKRMKKHIQDAAIKKRIVQISTHVHYADEIDQIINYLLDNKYIPSDIIGLVIDDINVGKINSMEALEEWKNHTRQMYYSSNKVIIEISSIKKLILSENNNIIYGNITSINNVIKLKRRYAGFIDAENLQKKYNDIKPIYTNEKELMEKMKSIKSHFPHMKILWVSHFRYKLNNDIGEIQERIHLNNWVSRSANSLGDDYLDLTTILDYLGQESATKDSSHFNEKAEILMSKIISYWIQNDKLPNLRTL